MGVREFLFKIMFSDFHNHYVFLKDMKFLQEEKHMNRYNFKPIDKYIKVFEAIKRDNVEVLGIEKNKVGEWVIIVKKMIRNDIWVELYSPTYLAINNHPRIMSTTYKNEATEYFAAENYVKIDDVLMQNNSIGNGSICMEYFIKEVKKQGFDYISGWLSSIDKDNFKRSIPFYKKFGFQVTMAKDNNSGIIKLDLTKGVDVNGISGTYEE